MFAIGNNAGYCPVVSVSGFESCLKAFHGYQSAWIDKTIVFESRRLLQACIELCAKENFVGKKSTMNFRRDFSAGACGK